MLRPNPKDEPIALPKFMGYKDRQLPREFLERYKEYCDVCSTATESHLWLLPVSLDTPPKQWWHFVGGFSEWNPFTADFEAEFTRVDYKAKLKDQRTQRPAENLKRPFIHAITEYYDRIGDSYASSLQVLATTGGKEPMLEILIGQNAFCTD